MSERHGEPREGKRGDAPPPWKKRGEDIGRARGHAGPRRTIEEVKAVEATARASCEAAGFGCIIVHLSHAGNLRVMLDRPGGGLITIADCAAASRAVEEGLRVAQIDPGSLQLEVESPGIDRPLTRPQDYERYAGERVTVTIKEPREGRRNYTGPLLKFENGDVTIHVLDEAMPETFKAAEIREVRLHPEPFKGGEIRDARMSGEPLKPTPTEEV